MACKSNESLVEPQRKFVGRFLIAYPDSQDIAGGPMQDPVRR